MLKFRTGQTQFKVAWTEKPIKIRLPKDDSNLTCNENDTVLPYKPNKLLKSIINSDY